MILMFYSQLASIDRPGMDELIQYLKNTGFDDTPASSKYHLAEPGGLIEHSQNVMDIALKLHKTLNDTVEGGIPEESVKLVALLHDVGKHKYYNKSYYTDNILKSGNRSTATPYKRNPDRVKVPHEIVSIQVVSKFITLTEEEMFAILYHNGLYGPLKYELIGNETPLYLILHYADMWASRVIE